MTDHHRANRIAEVIADSLAAYDRTNGLESRTWTSMRQSEKDAFKTRINEIVEMFKQDEQDFGSERESLEGTLINFFYFDLLVDAMSAEAEADLNKEVESIDPVPVIIKTPVIVKEEKGTTIK